MSIQGYWAELKAPDFQSLPGDCVAVLPLGATEQHGPHLPLSVDTDLTQEAVARMLAELSPEQTVLVLPALTITKSNEHNGFPGTLSLSPETLLAVLRGIGASVARAGVERLVLFNGHGGNTALLQVAARELRISYNLIAAVCSWSGFAETEGLFEPGAYAVDLHAGDSETSAMLAARPDLVDMGKAKTFRTAMEDWAGNFRFIGLTGEPAAPGWTADDLNPAGVCGDASAATAAKGEAMLASTGRNFALFLAEFSRFDHRTSR
ncbi:creatininase family protein [Leisingera sp. D0M16]|uniref:creatininase family protein n=1 Tax=Leisingera coralii TaxID=3351347 RepID=UPI003B785D43